MIPRSLFRPFRVKDGPKDASRPTESLKSGLSEPTSPMTQVGSPQLSSAENPSFQITSLPRSVSSKPTSQNSGDLNLNSQSGPQKLESARSACQNSSSPMATSCTGSQYSGSNRSGRLGSAPLGSTSVYSQTDPPEIERPMSIESEQALPDVEKSEIPEPESLYPAIANGSSTQQGIAEDLHPPAPDVRPCSDVLSDTIDDAATDLNLDDDDATIRNSVLNPDFIKGEAVPPPPPAPIFETLAQKDPKATDSLSITLGPPVIILFDVIVPCIIYYVWFDHRRNEWIDQCATIEAASHGIACSIPEPEYDRDILGYCIITFGFGELYILLARIWRLVKYQELCAPLLSKSKWGLDATSWVYAIAMIFALIPFVIGSVKEIPELYLYSPGFLMGFLVLLMILSLFPFNTPCDINSHAAGTRIRPFIYYAAEDFIAVDGLQDREFRVRYNTRYEHNKSFRRLFKWLTLWWILGVMVYLGALSAVIWTLEFHYAFGLSLGVLFGYIVVWAVTSYVWVVVEMRRERKAHEAGRVAV